MILRVLLVSLPILLLSAAPEKKSLQAEDETYGTPEHVEYNESLDVSRMEPGTVFGHRKDDGKTSAEDAQIFYSQFVLDGHLVWLPSGKLIVRDSCKRRPCVNGKCVVVNNGTYIETYICECSYGFGGTHCDKRGPTKAVFTCVGLMLAAIILSLATYGFISFQNGREVYNPKCRLRFYDRLTAKTT